MTLSLTPAKGMIRADLYYLVPDNVPDVVLVLCPGANADGKYLLESPAWVGFAKEHNLGLVGLSFASDLHALKSGSGYYYPDKGSGKKLIEGITKIYGRNIPILLYGFSGGAHFTSRFSSSFPERVTAWCAYSALWWTDPISICKTTPGLVLCGDRDQRLGASLAFYKKGRALGYFWLWAEIPNNGHIADSGAEKFVRKYFSAILCPQKTSTWVDIDRNEVVDENFVKINPSLSGYLPDISLLDDWRKINAK